MHQRIKASLLSMGLDVLLIAIKGTLSVVTGSAALLADAFHSLSDFFVSLAVLIGAVSRSWMERRSRRNDAPTPPQTEAAALPLADATAASPAQQEPALAKPAPGYWIEAGVAVIISLIILYLPYQIIAGVNQRQDYEIRLPWLAMAGTIVCIVIAYFLSRYKMYIGARLDSPALVADGYHSRMDMFTSIAVLVSIIGQMAGIRLDPLMAVIIAVLIALVGLELFVTSIMGFVRRSRLERHSLWRWAALPADRFVRWIQRRRVGVPLSIPEIAAATARAARRSITPRNIAAAVLLAVAIYFGSGVAMVRPDETGVRLRFGRILDSAIPPGLTYHLPWPFESLRRVPRASVFRVELGFRTDENLQGSGSPTLWETSHTVTGYTKIKNESITLSGDENILDISLVAHYRVNDNVAAYFRVNDMDGVVRGLLESALREVLSGLPSDSLLVEQRPETLKVIASRVRHDVARLDLGIEVMDVYCHDVHPPVDVVAAYRDVFSAREAKAQQINEAESHRNTALPKARSDSESQQVGAYAEAQETRMRAEGDATRFAMIGEAFRKAPDLTSFRMYIEMAEQALAGKKKIIADPAVNRGGYRLWMFAPDQGQLPASIMEKSTAGNKK